MAADLRLLPAAVLAWLAAGVTIGMPVVPWLPGLAWAAAA